MPPRQPPAELPGEPKRRHIAAGTVLWRVHPDHVGAAVADPPMRSVFGGGRFDAVAPEVRGQMYVSASDATAVLERFLPGLVFGADGRRLLLRRAIEGKRLSALEVTRDLTLLQLVSSEDLAAIGQDQWLLTETQYGATREWAQWLREKAPWADGIVWQSTVDMPGETMVLFERDTPAVAVVDRRSCELGGTERAEWLEGVLDAHGVRTDPLSRPRVKAFINYRKGECSEAALLLHNELSRRLGEGRVFRDNRSIRPGQVFPGELLDKVRTCRVLFVLISLGWEEHRGGNGRALDDPHDWVRREIEEATTAGAEIVPVLVGARRRLRKPNLPPALGHLAERQSPHLPHGFREVEVKCLVDRMFEQLPGLEDNEDDEDDEKTA
ncbi:MULTISPECIES: RES domain-containing protein [unclassified Amycolatopsis]|uniref:RES domain-containing protein n=1 Tax=unclassified Amycolatopsis TaxID=2618356 RepID=UPI0028766F37|nr:MULTISPECIES: RES domain-containing protein [unclassified Amycolatopsis]MDS0133224.1 RES domain-containing protein [Amycolatopsis sp. 505]MDS0146454.1 RES domain-containing protein [Amycolatopsis sp. CM201R]